MFWPVWDLDDALTLRLRILHDEYEVLALSSSGRTAILWHRTCAQRCATTGSQLSDVPDPMHAFVTERDCCDHGRVYCACGHRFTDH
jgi:hypothetical protein